MNLNDVPSLDGDIAQILANYRYPMGMYDEYPDMTDRELYFHLIGTGVIDTYGLYDEIVDQGVDATGIANTNLLALTAADHAFEMGAAFFGATGLDTQRQMVDDGWAEEHRSLLSKLAEEISNMPSGEIFGVDISEIKARFSAYHQAESAKLDGLFDNVLTYEEERADQLEKQEDLDTLPWQIQLALGAASDVADVLLFFREWYITEEFPVFSFVTLLPVINAGMRKAVGPGINLVGNVDNLLRQSDEVIGVTDEVADVTEISNRFVTEIDADGKIVSHYLPEETTRHGFPDPDVEPPDDIDPLFETVFGRSQDGDINVEKWFSENFSGTPISELTGYTEFGHEGILLSVQGVNPEILGISITEMNILIERYPFLFEGLEKIEVQPQGARYPFQDPDGTIRTFEGYAAHIPDPETGIARYLWINADIWTNDSAHRPFLQKFTDITVGRATEWEGLVGSEMSVMLPNEDMLNFQALTAHEVGHSMRNWLRDNGVEVDEIINSEFINTHSDTLDLFTMDSFLAENPSSEVFSELFAASRVLEEFEAGRLDEILVPDSLLRPEVREIIDDFDDWLDIQIDLYNVD